MKSSELFLDVSMMYPIFLMAKKYVNSLNLFTYISK